MVNYTVSGGDGKSGVYFIDLKRQLPLAELLLRTTGPVHAGSR